jgi:negative regulator of flagellin synthesis FlgM
MKISYTESGKASAHSGEAQGKILPEKMPKGSVTDKVGTGRSLSPLEEGMAVAEAALKDVPDVREDIVNELKEKIAKGEYNVSGIDIAEMMLRRRAADKLR